MRRYLQDCVTKCKSQGYVETITGRRRYLPAIKDNNLYARAHVSKISDWWFQLYQLQLVPGLSVRNVAALMICFTSCASPEKKLS